MGTVATMVTTSSRSQSGPEIRSPGRSYATCITRPNRTLVQVIRPGSWLVWLNGPMGSGPPFIEPIASGGLGLTDTTSNLGCP